MIKIEWHLINLDTGKNVLNYNTITHASNYLMTLICEVEWQRITKNKFAIENNIDIDKLIWL